MLFSFLWFVNVTVVAFKFLNQYWFLLFLIATLMIILGYFICLPIHGENYPVTGFDHIHVRKIFHFLLFRNNFRFIKFDCIGNLFGWFISVFRTLFFTLISMKGFNYLFKAFFCFLFFNWFTNVFKFNLNMFFIGFLSI